MGWSFESANPVLDGSFPGENKGIPYVGRLFAREESKRDPGVGSVFSGTNKESLLFVPSPFRSNDKFFLELSFWSRPKIRVSRCFFPLSHKKDLPK